ncbi:MAG: tRNA (adenosine(37)-N6)-threonylcarbamoyltransferase complex ATPase subunit type 1 TsaE [Pseudomonadota bacterium]
MAITTNLTLPDLPATQQFASNLASHIKGGDLILLDGVVGAGKTTLARGLIQALLGQDQEVPSPTFTLVQTYQLPSSSGQLPPPTSQLPAPTGLRLLHYDLYRLTDPEELVELGWDEVGADDTIALVEWPNRLGTMPPGNVLHLQIASREIIAERQLELHAYGDWGNRIGLLSM